MNLQIMIWFPRHVAVAVENVGYLIVPDYLLNVPSLRTLPLIYTILRPHHMVNIILKI